MRSAGYFIFWLVLTGVDGNDVVPGLIAAVISARVSLELLPANTLNFRPVPAFWLFLRFLGQSFTAGIQVARVAFDPRLPLAPGLVVHRTALPEGPVRDAFATISSLLPGTLPSGTGEGGTMIVHCLDILAPVNEQLEGEERRFVSALREVR
jgi:multicomponent Na+:H+ antiporter subunit E